MDTLTFMNFKDIPMRMITTSNRIERMNLELRRRATQVGTFPNVESCLRLNTLVCMEYVKTGICSPSFFLSKGEAYRYAGTCRDMSLHTNSRAIMQIQNVM